MDWWVLLLLLLLVLLFLLLFLLLHYYFCFRRGRRCQGSCWQIFHSIVSTFFFFTYPLLGLDLQLSRVVFNSCTFCFFNPGRLTLISLCPLERRNMTIKKTSNQIRLTRCLESKLLHVTNCSPQIHALLSTCITGTLRCKYQWSFSFFLIVGCSNSKLPSLRKKI